MTKEYNGVEDVWLEFHARNTKQSQRINEQKKLQLIFST